MDWRVQTVLILMHDNVRREPALDELAHTVNLSPSRFQHLFKAETGTTPACYLRTLRMRKSQEMLEATLLSVKEIMVAVGVKDRSHFERDFKAAFGLTPVQYRASAKLALSARPEIERVAGAAIK
jgi:AraC family transcriptional regulator of arabinose operon